MSALRINKMTLDNDGNGLISNDDDSSCSSSSGMNHETEESDDTSDNSGSGAYKEEKRVELAQNETAHVFRLRLAVFIVLFLAGLTVSIIVYFITDGSENEEAVVQYEGASEKIVEAFVGVADRFVAVSSLGVASIAHGVDHIRTWPFVTLSSFQERSAAARSDSGALYVQINPLVTAKDRNEWEHFVMGAEDRQWL